ncbi:MAG: gfo/Idh/MocA family oxidoreductase, partial [Kiritimatiellaeota bacterium]|nr:gfo/Idh/MocA family oxidoreductase [Kiritimatiellota bacterium]
VMSAETSSPATLEPHHPDLFWYGIHGVESLFTVMGTGCETVKRGTTADGKIEVCGTWAGGRTGIFREPAKGHTYGGTAKGEKGEAAIGAYDGYAPLLVEIMKFFQTGVAPVPERETLEILAFMEAADASKQANGAEIKIADILKKAGVE